MKLDGKVAIVTGAASGFGRAIAELFALEGARVVAADINGEGVRALAAGFGDKMVPVVCDVSKKADVDAMVRAATEAFGGLDIVVNNAGITHRNQPLLDVGEAEFDRIYAVTVKSIYLTTIAAVPK
jgi:3-oxoacyl-[acyl-carrier protein] reductase